MRKYKNKLLNTGVDSLKATSKKEVHKAGKFLGNENADAVTKSNSDKTVKPDENSRNVDEIISLEQRDEISKKLRKVL